jgi:WD40 repeat protein/formylglycine-generating enzyme required for sulfatase activity
MSVEPMNTLEIIVQRKSGTSWPVVVEYSRAGVLLPSRSEGVLEVGEERDQQLTSLLGQPRDYGIQLGQALFRQNVRDAFVGALRESEDQLRVLLCIEAEDLRSLRWERLGAPIDGGWGVLAQDQRTPFSLYIPSTTDRRFPPIGRRDLRALLLVASPKDSDRHPLAPFDVEATVASVKAALGTIPCDVLANVAGAIGSPCLDELCTRLADRSRQYTLLHVVCHGKLLDGGETALFWAKADNQVQPVTATDLLKRLCTMRGPRGLPHFAFLSACESADAGAEGALEGLAQRLVRELGMPAVLAMTEKVTMKTAAALAEAFYRQLGQSGEVDTALPEATTALATRGDILVPALFSRLGGRPLFSDQLDRELTNAEIKFGLDRLGVLLEERAPVLKEEFDRQAAIIATTLGADATALSRDAREERRQALREVNTLCQEALDLSFNALALGQQPPNYDARCPFRGLYPFGPEDRQFFFGRESLIEQLCHKLAEQNVLPVLGPSGSGKSSVVLAGLIPALQGQEKGLRVGALTPGSEPLLHLEAAVATLSDQAGVLVVDQFEEVFTLCADEAKRSAFIDQMLGIARSRRVVLTMRADFWGECAPYKNLKELMEARQSLIAPMDTAELRKAMEMQAATVGLRFEGGLSSRILDEVQGEPGAMPLLQHALLELWKRRHGRWLRADEYKNIGGVQKAIARTADDVYDSLSPDEQQQVRNIFVRLTRLDASAVQGERRRDTRRRVWLKDLVPAAAEPAVTERLVQRLAGQEARLVVIGVDETTQREAVEVAHEALIRHWPRLQKWLDEDRANFLLRDAIHQAADDWEQHSRDESYLIHRGGRLDDADALSRRSGFLNELEASYVRACLELQDRLRRQETERNRRERRRLRIAVGIVSALLVVATAAGAWAYLQKREALAQTAKSEQGRQIMSARSLLGRNDEQALLLAIQGERDLPSPEMEDLLRTLLWLRGRVVGVLEPVSEYPALSATWDPKSGRRVATINGDAANGIAKVRDTQTGETCRLPTREDKLATRALWNPQGTRVLTTSWDTVEIWNPLDCTKKLGWTAHGWGIEHAAWNSTGAQILTAGGYRDNSTVKIWDAQTGAFVREFDDHRQDADKAQGSGAVRHAAWSHDDTRIVTASDDGTARVWNPRTDKAVVLKGHVKGVVRAAWSRDDKQIVTASADGSARLWNAETGEPSASLLGHTDGVNDVEWSPDSTRIVTASSDGTARIWNVQTKESVVLIGHAQDVLSAAWKKDGERILTAGKDGTVKMWDATDGKEIARLAWHNGQIKHSEWDPDFSRVLTAGSDGAILVWDPEAPPTMPVLDHSEKGASEAIWSPNNTRILTIGGNTVRLWDPETGKELPPLTHPKDVVAALWSKDGQRIASASWDGFVRVWNSEGRRVWERKLFEPKKDSVFRIDWHPKHESVVAGGFDGHVGTVGVWNAENGQELRRLVVDEGEVPWAWNGKRTRFVTKIWRVGTASQLWDIEKGTKIPLSGHGDGVWDAAWSPDDKRVVTASNDKKIRVFDADTGDLIAGPEPSATGVKRASWNIGGTRIVSLGDDDPVARVWDAATLSDPLKLPHGAAIRDAEWSADQKFIATAGEDNSVRFWNEKGIEVRDPINHRMSKITSVRWDATGKRILTASDDGKARVFLLDSETLLNAACRRATRNMTLEEWKTFMGSKDYAETCPRETLHAGGETGIPFEGDSATSTSKTSVAVLAASSRAPAVVEAPSSATAEPGPNSPDGSADKDCSFCPQMLKVPAGGFLMGSPATDGDAEGNEKPQHAVTIAKPFTVSRYEITFAEWDACVADGGCNDYRPDDEGWGRSDSPVINLSWKEAQAYTRWLSGKTGKNYRLLTEAEWEFTARARRGTRYGWGDDVGAGNANCKTCGSQWDGGRAAPAGSFNPNPFGLFDMNGNVWEWVQDCSHPDYSGAPTDGSAWEAGPHCSERILRGGSWNNSAAAIRSAQRSGGGPDARANNVGFRVARDE